MEIQESSVTSCLYMVDCPNELIRAFWSVGSKQKRREYSDKVKNGADYLLLTMF